MTSGFAVVHRFSKFLVHIDWLYSNDFALGRFSNPNQQGGSRSLIFMFVQRLGGVVLILLASLVVQRYARMSACMSAMPSNGALRLDLCNRARVFGQRLDTSARLLWFNRAAVFRVGSMLSAAKLATPIVM